MSYAFMGLVYYVLVIILQNGAGKPEDQEDRKKNEVNSRIPSLIPVISPDLFKLPSQKVLLMERVTAG